MNARTVSFPEHLSNQELMAALPLLARHESHAIAELVAHLAEVDARRLYREQAFPSMHQYCVDALHLCEGAAYKRITAARAARRFPTILEMLADGRLHLSAVCLLAPHLTEENHPSLLEAAVHRSKRGVELLLAGRFPKPDVPQSIRKLPVPQPRPEAAVPSPVPILIAARPLAPSLPLAPVTAAASGPPAHPGGGAPPPGLPAASALPPRPAVVAPLAPERFKLQLTISKKTRERLEEARDLLGHQVPDGDLAEVLDRALDVLVRELRRNKYAETDAPQKPRAVKENGGTRHIPNHVKREVAKRDGHQCTFVAENGQRCPARGRLEFHHIDPHAQGGPPTLSDVTLRCRAHNGYAAEVDYGAELVARRIAEARQGRQGRVARAPGAVKVPGLFDSVRSTAETHSTA
jgi:hypothetical protein